MVSFGWLELPCLQVMGPNDKRFTKRLTFSILMCNFFAERHLLLSETLDYSGTWTFAKRLKQTRKIAFWGRNMETFHRLLSTGNSSSGPPNTFLEVC